MGGEESVDQRGREERGISIYLRVEYRFGKKNGGCHKSAKKLGRDDDDDNDGRTKINTICGRERERKNRSILREKRKKKEEATNRLDEETEGEGGGGERLGYYRRVH